MIAEDCVRVRSIYYRVDSVLKIKVVPVESSVELKKNSWAKYFALSAQDNNNSEFIFI